MSEITDEKVKEIAEGLISELQAHQMLKEHKRHQRKQKIYRVDKKTRYNFSKNACVYCHSGCYSQDWV